MIVRLWRGRTTLAREAAYRRHVEDELVGRLQTVAGHVSAYLLRQQQGGAVELVVVTTWESMGAVRAFAGERDPEAVAGLTGPGGSAEHADVAPAQG